MRIEFPALTNSLQYLDDKYENKQDSSQKMTFV